MRRTYSEARKELLYHLKDIGWHVVEYNRTTMRPMKVPHATSPHGTLRLYFHAQAVHYSQGNLHSENGAHSLFLDIRALTVDEFIAEILHKVTN